MSVNVNDYEEKEKKCKKPCFGRPLADNFDSQKPSEFRNKNIPSSPSLRDQSNKANKQNFAL